MLFCSLRLPWPYKALKVPFSFCCKIAMKRCFSLVGGSLVFCGSLLGLFFIKAYFRASFFAFFSFCYTSHAKRTIFKMRSGTFFGSFCNHAFHCRHIAKNEALKLPIFTSRFRKDNFVDLNCKKPTRR